MDLLRRHMFTIICSLVAAGGVGLMFTGMQKMPGVVEEMKKVEGIHRSLTGIKPVSKATIDAEQQRIELVNADREKVITKAKELYGYEPLVAGALPVGDSLKRIDFRNAYRREMEALLKSLNYGGTASASDLATARDRIAEEEAERREQKKSGMVSADLRLDGPTHSKAGVITETGVRQDAIARASIAAAQRIYCYGVHFDQHRPPAQISSLDYRDAMKDADSVDAPDDWEVWHAQIGFWIQRDIIRAIAAVNNEAADTIKQQGRNAWVGNMPVKEVISIRLWEGLIPRDGESVFGPRAGGFEEALPPGTPETVFTHSGQHENYEVVQYSLKLIMQQRDLPKLIDRLSKNSFHTLLRVSYNNVSPNRTMQGKIYGTEPTVNVIMDFQTVLLAEVFRCLMPASVCEYYEVPCPAPEDCGITEDEESS